MSSLTSVRRVYGFCAAFTVLTLLAGCSRPTPIKELASNPDNYRGKDVQIHGKVISSFSMPMLEKPIYFVSDGTGQMAVQSSGGIPATNSEVTVIGKIQDVPPVALPFVGKMNLAPIMLEETERQASGEKQ
ncbi:MAG: hypothetical protein KY468_19590 [Armatimonadetes bacterium]|nr:hypothetical protein [Armatimonadota bacterium]